MLTTISWADYTTGAAIGLIIYYVFVGLRYFSADLKDLVAGKRKPHLQALAMERHADTETNEDPADIKSTMAINSEAPADEAKDAEMDEVEKLIGHLSKFIKESSHNQVTEQDFKDRLQQLLNKYPDIKNSPLRPSVNELIVSECEKYGAVTLSEKDVDGLWENER